MKSELFAKILSAVAETTELSSEAILSQNKTEECVAARALFVHFCCVKGVPTCAIRDYLGRKRNDCITKTMLSIMKRVDIKNTRPVRHFVGRQKIFSFKKSLWHRHFN